MRRARRPRVRWAALAATCTLKYPQTDPDTHAAPRVAKGADINATGQPDTPLEVINALLAQSLDAASPEEAKRLVQQAYRISSGLDAYLDKMLSPVPQACQDLIAASAEHDWDKAYADVRRRHAPPAVVAWLCLCQLALEGRDPQLQRDRRDRAAGPPTTESRLWHQRPPGGPP